MGVMWGSPGATSVRTSCVAKVGELAVDGPHWLQPLAQVWSVHFPDAVDGVFVVAQC